MKTIDITIGSLDELQQAARTFMGEMGDYTVFAFVGEMGAGKTTFINALCHELGVTDDATNSPTFALINEYRSDTTAELIYHIDCYRLENLDEAVDMCIEDYMDCGAVCLIEWPERIEPLLPDDTVIVEISADDSGTRHLRMSLPQD